MTTATKILHAIPADPLTGSISVPVYQTSTFVQHEPGVHKGFDYARSNNPTRQVLENLIAELEQGHSGLAFATGLAAIDAVLKLLKKGDEVLAVDDIYGGSFRLFTHVYEKLGITFRYVDSTSVENVREAISDKTKLVWLESPTNPTLKVSDIRRIAAICKDFGSLLVVDNTFASPVAQQPLKLGAHIVIHSATKYLGGHSDLVAGLLVTKNPELSEKLKFIQNASGGILGPWDCFLTIRGIETLPLRFEKQSENALRLAEELEKHPAVDKVYYPGLPDHKNHHIAHVQQNGLYGGVLSFSLVLDDENLAKKLVSSTRLFKLAESLGGVKSLLCHPASMTHASIPAERRRSCGVQDSLIRLSCGIENFSDLKEDVFRALEQVSVLATTLN